MILIFGNNGNQAMKKIISILIFLLITASLSHAKWYDIFIPRKTDPTNPLNYQTYIVRSDADASQCLVTGYFATPDSACQSVPYMKVEVKSIRYVSTGDTQYVVVGVDTTKTSLWFGSTSNGAVTSIPDIYYGGNAWCAEGIWAHIAYWQNRDTLILEAKDTVVTRDLAVTDSLQIAIPWTILIEPRPTNGGVWLVLQNDGFNFESFAPLTIKGTDRERVIIGNNDHWLGADQTGGEEVFEGHAAGCYNTLENLTVLLERRGSTSVTGGLMCSGKMTIRNCNILGRIRTAAAGLIHYATTPVGDSTTQALHQYLLLDNCTIVGDSDQVLITIVHACKLEINNCLLSYTGSGGTLLRATANLFNKVTISNSQIYAGVIPKLPSGEYTVPSAMFTSEWGVQAHPVIESFFNRYIGLDFTVSAPFTGREVSTLDYHDASSTEVPARLSSMYQWYSWKMMKK